MKNQVRIDLQAVKTPADSKVFSGRDAGEAARKKLNLDKIDREGDVLVVVSIPADTYSMNMSFFLGLFGPSVRCLSPAGFREKYQFECKPVHLPAISEGIDRAVKEATIFKEKKTA